eukprot:403346712
MEKKQDQQSTSSLKNDQITQDKNEVKGNILFFQNLVAKQTSKQGYNKQNENPQKDVIQSIIESQPSLPVKELKNIFSKKTNIPQIPRVYEIVSMKANNMTKKVQKIADKRSLQEQFEEALRLRQQENTLERQTEVHKLQTLEYLQSAIRNTFSNNNVSLGQGQNRNSYNARSTLDSKTGKKSRKLNMAELQEHEQLEQMMQERTLFDAAFQEIYEEYEIEWVSDSIRELFQSVIREAIEDRLCELSGEIVEQEQNQALRQVVEECIQQISFELAMPLVENDLTESLLLTDLKSLVFGCIEQEQTLHTVDLINEETVESTLMILVNEIAQSTLNYERVLVQDTEDYASGLLIDAEITKLSKHVAQEQQALNILGNNEQIKEVIVQSYKQLKTEKYLQTSLVEDIYLEMLDQQIQMIASTSLITARIKKQIDSASNTKEIPNVNAVESNLQEKKQENFQAIQEVYQIKVKSPPEQLKTQSQLPTNIVLQQNKNQSMQQHQQQQQQNLSSQINKLFSPQPQQEKPVFQTLTTNKHQNQRELEQRKTYIQRESANFVIRPTIITHSKSPLRQTRNNQNDNDYESDLNDQDLCDESNLDLEMTLDFQKLNNNKNNQNIIIMNNQLSSLDRGREQMNDSGESSNMSSFIRDHDIDMLQSPNFMSENKSHRAPIIQQKQQYYPQQDRITLRLPQNQNFSYQTPSNNQESYSITNNSGKLPKNYYPIQSQSRQSQMSYNNNQKVQQIFNQNEEEEDEDDEELIQQLQMQYLEQQQLKQTYSNIQDQQLNRQKLSKSPSGISFASQYAFNTKDHGSQFREENSNKSSSSASEFSHQRFNNPQQYGQHQSNNSYNQMLNQKQHLMQDSYQNSNISQSAHQLLSQQQQYMQTESSQYHKQQNHYPHQSITSQQQFHNNQHHQNVRSFDAQQDTHKHQRYQSKDSRSGQSTLNDNMISVDKNAYELMLLQQKERQLIEEEKLKQRLRDKIKKMDWNESDSDEDQAISSNLNSMTQLSEQNQLHKEFLSRR